MKRRRLLALPAALMAPMAADASDAGVRCVLRAPSRAKVGAPVPLRFTLANRSKTSLRLLEWNTPIEGWFAPFVLVTRDGTPLAYRGPAMKRGEPTRDEYFMLGAGRSRTTSVNLAEAFDLSQPGRYRVQPQLTLFDVVDAAQPYPRPREQHESKPVACNTVEIELA